MLSSARQIYAHLFHLLADKLHTEIMNRMNNYTGHLNFQDSFSGELSHSIKLYEMTVLLKKSNFLITVDSSHFNQLNVMLEV